MKMKQGMKKVLVLALTLAMLMGNSISSFAAVVGDFSTNFIFKDVTQGDKVVSEKGYTVNGVEGELSTVDITDELERLGYEVDGKYTTSAKVEIAIGQSDKDVYVKPSQKETVLNVTFETVYGEVIKTEKVSTTVMGADGEAWTFMLGTDFNLPTGYQLATGVEQVTSVEVPFGATGGHTIVVEPIPTEQKETVLNVTFETVYGEVIKTEKVSTTAMGADGEAWTFMLGTDFNLPTGYQLATGVEQVTSVEVPFGATGGHTIVVEPIPTAQIKTVLNVTFETVYGEVIKTEEVSTTAMGADGEAWTFMLGTDFELPTGYQLAAGVEQVTNIQVPFGAMGGHTIVVEPIPEEPVYTVLNITFETVYGEKVGAATASTAAVGADGEAWTFMLGTDFNLPAGYQLATGVDQIVDIQIPFGATGGHTIVVEPIPVDQPETVLNLTFETVTGEVVGTAKASTSAVGADGEAWTFMLGTDFELPTGYQLATGVDQVTNIEVPFGAIAGHTMVVEPIAVEPEPEPEDPEKPDTPSEDKKPVVDENNKDKADDKATDENTAPKTGDATSVATVMVVMIASCAVAFLVIARKKRSLR